MEHCYSDSARFVLETICSLGLTLSPDSRLAKMCKLLTERPNIPFDDPDLEAAKEGAIDVTEFNFIFDQLKDSDKHDRTYLSKVKKAISDSDSVMPQDDPQHSNARDAQFELFVHALCRSSVLVPVELEPFTDVGCWLNGVNYTIEAKRIKNIARLQTRIREAAIKINKSNLFGMIAVHSALAMNPENERVTAKLSDAQFSAYWGREYQEFITKHKAWILKEVEGTIVLGVCFHDHALKHLSGSEWQVQGLHFLYCTNQENRRKGDTLSNIYFSGLPSLVQLGSARAI